MIRWIGKKKIIALLLLCVLRLLFCYEVFDIEDGNAETWDESESYRLKAENIVTTMSLEEKIYQMCVVSPEQITGVSRVVAAGETTRNALQKYPVGGLIYSQENIVSKKQISKVIGMSQTYSKTPLFIAIEEEGSMTGLKPMYSYRNEGKRVSEKNAAHIAETIKKLGFNMDLAPVADVWSNRRNTIVSDHAYSDDYERASKLIASAIKGFHKEKVICTLKHFPGGGDLCEELSTGKTFLKKTKKELEQEELKSFRAGILAGADVVMVGHMTVSDLDADNPASLSGKVITEVLREEMGFNGLVMTESLSEDIIKSSYTAGEAAVKAVKAGSDIVLEPASVEEAVNAILYEVNIGSITEAQINESVERIIETKIRAGIIH